MNRLKKVSIIIPVYNEEKVIGNCLKSLAKQSYKLLEVIVVDDGSTDKTIEIIKNRQSLTLNCHLFKQKHHGPGSARNLGANKARGEILVFVDADMTFGTNFIQDLIKPILTMKTIGTFSKNEIVSNPNNIWSICWNINKNLPRDRMIPQNYPDKAPVFRAILKSEFEKAGGFDENGEYTDDWSLSRKLAKKSTLTPGAIYYHSNPDNLLEIWQQARWIGKNEFISGDLPRKVKSLFFYSLPISFIVGSFKSVINFNFNFLVFKIVYDFGVFVSVINTYISESKAK